MYASVRSWVERVRLWVDNVILIDQWTSLEGTENSGTIYMGTAGGYYDVVMEYKQPNGTGGDQGVVLEIMGGFLYKSKVDFLYLFSHQLVSQKLPFNISVYPAEVCATLSFSNLSDFESTSPGVIFYQMFFRDKFGNQIDNFDLIPILVKTESQSFLTDYFLQSAYLLDSNSTSAALSMTVTRSGHYSVFLSLFLDSGLHVIYFTDSACHIPFLDEIVPEVHFSNSKLNIRCVEWSGFVFVQKKGIYHLNLRSDGGSSAILNGECIARTLPSSENLTSVMVDMSLEPNTAYHLSVHFLPQEGPNNTLFLSFSQKGSVDSVSYFTNQHMIGNNSVSTQLVISPGACASNFTTALGGGVSSGIAGLVATFSLVCKDDFGNEVRNGGDTFLLKVDSTSLKSRSTIFQYSITDLNDGHYLISYNLTAITGIYDMK
eukprot:764900-Hanusia_phi.AAC.1